MLAALTGGVNYQNRQLNFCMGAARLARMQRSFDRVAAKTAGARGRLRHGRAAAFAPPRRITRSTVREPPMIELRHLRYFTAVAEELNFTRAAERVHIDPTPLARTVRDLEERLASRSSCERRADCC